ncbi:hypothetical protein Bca52824_062117 [Brassica carinata]|uniref:Uncharacterized protein n=1 Tax=Brassica carinata TaxID=52824 RepID=A0A8X7QCA4_BRACI|nr:hypothetical protein Bca52824_062117 [Brassica carinata]
MPLLVVLGIDFAISHRCKKRSLIIPRDDTENEDDSGSGSDDDYDLDNGVFEEYLHDDALDNNLDSASEDYLHDDGVEMGRPIQVVSLPRGISSELNYS